MSDEKFFLRHVLPTSQTFFLFIFSVFPFSSCVFFIFINIHHENELSINSSFFSFFIFLPFVIRLSSRSTLSQPIIHTCSRWVTFPLEDSVSIFEATLNNFYRSSLIFWWNVEFIKKNRMSDYVPPKTSGWKVGQVQNGGHNLNFFSR